MNQIRLLALFIVLVGCREQQSEKAVVQEPIKQDTKKSELAAEYELVKAKQLGQANSEEYIIETLGKLSPQGVKSLLAGERTVYFSDASVNAHFLENLKSHASNWKKYQGKYLKIKAAEKKKEAEYEARFLAQDKAKEKQLAVERKAYAKTLRNDFLDNSLDIDVVVNGANATHLTLKYSLFSAVWARKLQTGGFIAGSSLNDWHDKGFTKITLTDGYDYASSFTF